MKTLLRHGSEGPRIARSGTIAEELDAVLGPGRISIEPDDLAAHARDSWPAVSKWTPAEAQQHWPMCVARPRSTEEVALILQIATKHRLAVVPYGGGSGVTGAAIPTAPAISLDTRALSRLIEIDQLNWTVTAEAGAIGADVEKELNSQGFTLGHYPQSLFLSTVGGWVATAATGTFSSKYGGIEDILLALELVLPTGEIIQTRQIARSSAGPRAAHWFVGSEGALGVICRVTLKVMPIPQTRRFRAVAMPDIDAGLRAIRQFYRSHLTPAVIRLYEEQEAAHLAGAAGLAIDRPLLLLGVEGLSDLAEMHEKKLLEMCAAQGGQDLGPDVGNAWEKNRFNAEWLELGNAGEGRMADAIDLAADWKQLSPLYHRMMRALRPLVSKLWAHYSHFSAHGGSIYFIVFIQAHDRVEAQSQYAKVWETAMETLLSIGGSIAHHHGAGLVRKPYLARELGTEIMLLRKLKGALDPHSILNPGKLGL